MQKKYFLFVISIVFFLQLNSCSDNFKTQPSNINQIINFNSERRNLFKDFYNNGGIIIYPSMYKEIYFSPLRELHNRFRLNLKIKSDKEVSNKDLKNNAIILVGTIKSNKILNEINGELPVDFNKNSFTLNDVTYSKPDELISIFYKNPFNKNKLCFVLSGNSDLSISKNLNINAPWRMSGIKVSKSYETLALDFFKLNEEGKWGIDKSRALKFENKVIKTTEKYNYISHSNSFNKNLVDKINEENESSFEKIKSFFGENLKYKRTNVNLYNNFEDKGLIIDNTSLSNIINSDTSIHVVVNNWISGNDFSNNAKILIRYNLGIPKRDFLETGLSIYFSKNWRGKGYKYWASKIFLSGNLPDLSEVLDNDKINYISRFIVEPASASFVDFLLNKYGREKFISFYKNWNPNFEEIKKLNEEWKNYLQGFSEEYKNEIQNDRNNFNSKIPSFQKGFCFAHVGYQIYNGYLSREAYKSLQKIKKLNANSFSITPFTSMRNANKPVPLRFWEFAGAENDESLIYLKHAADKLNMTVLMKPQIYLGQSGWPGDIEMENAKDWKLFFHYYYNWIIHYAILSEIYQIPILTIGNEFSKTTLGHEKQWIKLIDKIKSIYSGKILYSANWGEEFENITLWKHLDFIGLSEYYPLSTKDNPTDKELYEGAEKVMDKIEAVQKKYNKKVIFTEVGFRSSQEPWKTALENSGRKKMNLKNQVRTYEALFKAAYNKKWLAGMYWWKWPSYLSYNGNNYDEGEDLYPPNNKPAEDIVKKWYMKKWN